MNWLPARAELHATKEDVSKMGIHDLKELLHRRGVDCTGIVDKCDLVARVGQMLEEQGGSSATSCSICCEVGHQGWLLAWAAGAVACVDAWGARQGSGMWGTGDAGRTPRQGSRVLMQLPAVTILHTPSPSAHESVCCCTCCSAQDYEPGDAVRVLRCKHRFHIE